MLSADHLTLAAWALEIILTVYTASIFFIAIPSVFQERRIWKSPLLPSLSFFGHVRVYIFNVMWMSITLSGGLLLLPKFFVGKIFGFDCQYEAYLVEQITAEMCFSMVVGWKPEIRGVENLPPDDGCAPAPVYVANHASQIDLAAFYFLGRRFKWISKDSVKWLPGVGLIMSLSQHVFIQRTGKNKKSVSNLYQQSNNAIQAGRPMFFFPQGTRRMAVRLPFKDGAYKVALENESLLVPITIEIPHNVWNNWYPLCLLWGGTYNKVVLTIHKPVKVKKNMDREAIKKQTYDAIFSVLPLVGEEITETKKEK